MLLAAAIIGFLTAWILRRFLYNVDLGAYEERIHTEQAHRRVVEEDLASARRQNETAAAEMAVIRTRLADMEREASALTADLGGAHEVVTARDGRIEQLESTVSGLESDLTAAESELGRHEATIEQLRADLAAADALRAEIERRGARIAELEVLVVERDASDEANRVAELQAALADTEAALDDARRRLAETDSDADDEPGSERESATEDRVADPPTKDEAVARMAEIASRTAGTGDAVVDDLKKIHGVGPKIEQLLNSLGITSFRQVARFEPADIAVVTAALDAFPGRIERDDWMTSAAELHEEKYGERP